LARRTIHLKTKQCANRFRPDPFDWQGQAFYAAIGCQLAGSYTNPLDGFSEFFHDTMLPQGADA